MRTMSATSSLLILFFVLFSFCSSSVSASIPQSFRHTNLHRTIDLTKPYIRESTTIVLENIGNKTQTEYFWGIPLSLVPKLSYLEVKEKSSCDSAKLPIEKVERHHPTLQLFKIQLPGVIPGEKIPLVVSSAYINSLKPYPGIVAQDAKQYLLYTGEKYVPTLYSTLKQKTNIKLPGATESYTQGDLNVDGKSDPTKSGNVLAYGPYGEMPPTTGKSSEQINVHFEYTAPIVFVEHLERDIEVSHWGNNLAIEERYKLTNHAARLKDQFSRIQYSRNRHASPPSHAVTKLAIPLKHGARNPYYTDIIGNVSTSRFRPAIRKEDANLEINPRYPIYGGWNYTFRLGWNVNLHRVQRLSASERMLKIPLLEGPENIEYETVDINIILPEGSRNLRVFTPMPAISEEHYLHHTFLDSLGRTAVKLRFENLVDEKRGAEIVVVYEYPWFAGFRKVVVVATGVLAIFVLRLVGGRAFKGGIGD